MWKSQPKRCSVRLSAAVSAAIAAEVLAASFLARGKEGSSFFRCSHRERPMSTKQAAVFATILTRAAPQVPSTVMWNAQPQRPDTPTAMENKLAAEAKTLNLLIRPISEDVLMQCGSCLGTFLTRGIGTRVCDRALRRSLVT